ncbi:glycosyltransferase family 25 protein [Hoeflea sp.]|uniref:glycosyltransferase family 25 protein n=1 Tax=Hoeflea sp. TaxID=1940281 RepID=UPI0019910B7D|nr:glycosyltransferase family 25 protein [Hoeflea sp.]MBC7282752.1 glycosyltransferase family 25 protein [Hoeflea sp.]
MTAIEQIPIFYINMEDAIERRDWFEAQAARLGLTVQRVDAVAGRQLPEETLARLKASIRSGTPLGPSEIGCFLSHRKAWEQVLATGAPWAFVAEDDLHLAGGAADYFRSTGWIPPDAQLVKAETTFRRCHMARAGRRAPDGRTLRQLLSLHGGAGGYFLSRKAAQDALDLTRAMCEPADHVLFNPDFGFFNTHATYQIDPAIAVQDLLRRDNKAGFLQSGLAIERRAQSRPRTGKLVREIARPFQRLAQAFRDDRFSRRLNTLFERVDYRL